MSSSSSSHHQTLAVGQSQKESYCPGYLVSLFQNHLVNLKEQGVPSPDSDSAATRVECSSFIKVQLLCKFVPVSRSLCVCEFLALPR
jgi:hypothetical protein